MLSDYSYCNWAMTSFAFAFRHIVRALPRIFVITMNGRNEEKKKKTRVGPLNPRESCSEDAKEALNIKIMKKASRECERHLTKRNMQRSSGGQNSSSTFHFLNTILCDKKNVIVAVAVIELMQQKEKKNNFDLESSRKTYWTTNAKNTRLQSNNREKMKKKHSFMHFSEENAPSTCSQQKQTF